MRRRFEVVAVLDGQEQKVENYDTYWFEGNAQQAADKWNSRARAEGIDVRDLYYKVRKA